jgi:hypothetical protein
MGVFGSKEKVALCFLISYEHRLTHESLWREWIAPNSDIIQIYFHYKDLSKIQSSWIRSHALPPEAITQTSYFNIVPALFTMLAYAYHHDKHNTWFCFFTESCVPIVSPEYFRRMFQQYKNENIMKWQAAYWNIQLHQRANLRLLPSEFHLSNDPWIILSRDGVEKCLNFMLLRNQLYQTICAGGLANESIFSIVFQSYHILSTSIRNEITTLCDWKRKSSPTSPYLFNEATQENKTWILQEKEKHPFAFFLRKVSPNFPDETLKDVWFTSRSAVNHAGEYCPTGNTHKL